MNKKQWTKYNQNIIDRGIGITFTYYQAKLLVRLFDDVSKFVLMMDEDSPKAVYNPKLFWFAFNQLCRTCDELDTKFIFKMQDQLNGKRG